MANTKLPLLLVHGFPFSGDLWREQVAAFGDERTVLAPTLRGLGGSVLDTDAPPSLEVYAADLLRLLDAQGIDKAIVCGFSMGGYITLAMWRLYAERIAALVLADTQHVADTPQAKQQRADGLQVLAQKGVAAYVETQLPRYFAAATWQTQPQVVQRVREMMLTASAEGVEFGLQALIARPDSTPQLPTISVPTLVLVGEHDSLTPPTVAAQMAEQIPNAEISVIPEAGHMTNVEQPAMFNRKLADFLANL